MLVGIAAGAREHVSLGSVVLAERVVAYEPAAVVAGVDGPREEPRPEVNRLVHIMEQDVATYRPNQARLAELFARIAHEGARAATIEVKRATLASGDKLLRDSSKQAQIRELHGKVEAFDMESAGLVEACRRDNIPWLVIRGISDYGDTDKDDRFQENAARAAAVVLVDFLAHGLDLPPAG